MTEFTEDTPVGVSEEDIKLNEQLNAEEKPAEEAPQADVTQTEESSPAPTEGEYTFKVKGEDVGYSHNQIQSMLAREQTFQQKYNEVSEGDDQKLGVLLSAAKGGDDGAKREVYDMLKASMGDGDLLDLEDVDAKFDPSKARAEEKTVDAVDDAFADVKGDVDFEDTMTKIKEQIAPQMHDSVFQSYWDNPTERRVMYDFAKSGKADELFSALETELSKLPLGERVAIKKDPDAYGIAIGEVVKSLSAPAVAPAKDQGSADLSAVSTGQGSRSQEKSDGPPDFDRMSMAEFKQWQIDNYGKVL